MIRGGEGSLASIAMKAGSFGAAGGARAAVQGENLRSLGEACCILRSLTHMLAAGSHAHR